MINLEMDKATIVKAAEDILASAKSFDRDAIGRMRLAKEADNLRYYCEGAFGTIRRRSDSVRKCRGSRAHRTDLPQIHLTAALDT